MSLETYLKRIVKPNDLPYVKQAIKEWLLEKQKPINSTWKLNKLCNGQRSGAYNIAFGKKCLIDELLEELQK